MQSSPRNGKSRKLASINKTFGTSLEFLAERDSVAVPRIVDKLCQYLKLHGLNHEGLFRVNGNMKVVERLKTAFDKDWDVNLEEVGDVAAVASLLKMFLRELSEPVFPDELLPYFIALQDECSNDKSKMVPRIKELLFRMPKVNVSLLRYLCDFMLSISANAERNKMNLLALAIVFGPNLFRCGDGLEGLREQAYVNAVLLTILQEYDELLLKNAEIFEENPKREPPPKPGVYLEHARIKKINSKPARPPPPKSPPPSLPSNISEMIDLSVLSPVGSLVTDLKSPRGDRSLWKLDKGSEQDSSKKKQLVDVVINDTLREHLFGPASLLSPTKSENVFEFRKRPDNPGDILSNSKMDESPGTNEIDHKVELDDEPFDLPDSTSRPLLRTFTSGRAPPPSNRRLPSRRYQSRSDSSAAEVGLLDDDSRSSNGGMNSGFCRQSYAAEKIARSSSARAQKSQTDKRNVNDSHIADIAIDSRVDINRHSNRRSASITLEEPQKRFPSARRTSEINSLDHEKAKVEDLVPLAISIEDQEDLAKQKLNTTPLGVSAVPPLDLLRLQQEENSPEISPRGRSRTLVDSPVRSPRSLPTSPIISKGERKAENWEGKRRDMIPIYEKPSQVAKREASHENKFERKLPIFQNPNIQEQIGKLGTAKTEITDFISDCTENADLVAESTFVDSNMEASPSLRGTVAGEVGTKEQTLASLLKKLKDKRVLKGRSEDIQAMTHDELQEEKLAVQKSLLHYESLHGRPVSKEDKDLMRPIYDRYRRIKRLIAAGPVGSQNHILRESPSLKASNSGASNRGSSFPDRAVGANGIDPKNELNSSLLSKTSPAPHSGDLVEAEATGEIFDVTSRFLGNANRSVIQQASIDEAVLHDARLPELLEQRKLTRKAKKQLGKRLKEYEMQFAESYGRKIGKDDRLPMQPEYREYKLIKSKLRLVETLIAKKQSNQTI